MRANGTTKFLRWVFSYKHVGTKSDIGAEVSSRCASMRQAFASMRKHIFRNPHVSIHRKLVILHTYILTKGTFQCGVWPELSSSLMKRFSACIVSMYREVTDNLYDVVSGSCISDAELFYRYDLILPSTILRFARLSLLGRLCAKAHDYLFSMVVTLSNCEGSWSSLVCKDLLWLTTCPAFTDGLGLAFGDWCDSIKNKPKYFRLQLKRLIKLRIANIPPEIVIASSTAAADCGQFQCDSCSSCFNTFHKLSLHMFKKHDVKNVWRRYVYAHTHCPICMRNFWSRERLINHIRYRSRICRHNIILRGFKCSEEEACVIDSQQYDIHIQLQKAGKRRHAAIEPVVRLAGPLLPVLLPDDIKPSKHHALGFGQNYF